MEMAENYHEIIKGLPAAIYICNAEGKITAYNEAAAELWGRQPEIGKDTWCGSWKLFHTDGTPVHLREYPMAVTLKEGRAIPGKEIVIERPDGKRVNVLPYPRPLFDESGKMIGGINSFIELTGKKTREEPLLENEEKYLQLSLALEKKMEERATTLKQSEERYHKMIEEVEDYAILLLDKEGIVQNWNKGAEKIKGYSENEIIGKHFRIFYLEEDRNQKLPDQLIHEASEKGKAMHEGWRLRKDGTKFWGSIVITALHDDENKIIGFSKVTRDLTQRKLNEDKLKAYTKELEFQNKQLEEYAHVASHDLQEPLRKIKTFVNLIMKNIDDRVTVNKYIDKINASAGRMELLIKDVLTYSQLSQTDELFVSTDLNKVVENVIEDYDLLLEQKQAKITFSALPVINAITIQMNQLFSNIISNSLKFCNEFPHIEITCENLSPAKLNDIPLLEINRDYVKITVKDNGIGFGPEYAEQVFKLFQRLHNDKYGTGIGLAICKKIAENHKGHITVSSEPNKGTTFNIFLPVL